MKFISWNVNGVRAQVKKDFFKQFKKFNADFFAIQETKAQDDQVAEALSNIKGYHLYSNSAEKKGYSGVAILAKQEPLSVLRDIGIEEHDNEGRVLTLEYDDFYFCNVYVPNSGSELKRLDYRSTWDAAFANYLGDLQKTKPVIVTGDFNVAHQAIDLARPKPNYNKVSGFTQVEIDGIQGILDTGMSDTFRELHPEIQKFTFWSTRFGARGKNIGWRIDYFLVSSSLLGSVQKAEIFDQEMGSDHCPITLDLSSIHILNSERL